VNRPVRTIAFYLPQFHRVKENDEWWGEGFTEWTNVRKASPLYAGHEQPKRPGPLGYYDLLDPAAREAQASLARRHGIEAFCYWHYWFGDGRRILERPFDDMLNSSKPDFPFCLCWANESWTGIWHGAPGRMLMEQKYPGIADEEAHFEILRRAFSDPRYVRIDGKPLFLIYSPTKVPDLQPHLARLRDRCKKSGFGGAFLVGMTTEPYGSAFEGFDAVVPSEPGTYLRNHMQMNKLQRALRIYCMKKWAGKTPQWLKNRLHMPDRYPFKSFAHAAFRDWPLDGRTLPCALAGWDNTPRSGYRGVVLDGYDPAEFRSYLKKAFDLVRRYPAERRIVFIKAWNEWAEGNYLEPDRANGNSFLEAVRDSIGASLST
jgi:lipopolysaccharide biosynthesis protein